MRLPLLLGALLGASRILMGQQPVLPDRSVEGGVTVLTHRADALGKAPGWKLGALIGRAGGAGASDLDLSHVDRVALMRDGRMLTLSPVGNRFYRFSATGKFEQALARQGAGPGEIMAPMGLGEIGGDTVFVVDGSNNRINWFTAQKFVRSVPIPQAGGVMNPAAVGRLRTGELVMRDFGISPSPREKFPMRIKIRTYVMPASAATVRSIAEVPDLQFTSIETDFRGKRNVMTDVVKFSPMAHVAVLDSAVVTASSHTFRWELRSRNGAQQRQIRLLMPRRPVTSAMRDASIAEMLDRMNGPHTEGMVDKSESIRLAKSAPTADSLPAFDAIFVSRDQLLWVVDAQAPNDQSGAATAFRSDGAIVGRLNWNGKRMPLAFGPDRVVMRETDSDGVVSLAIYKLVK